MATATSRRRQNLAIVGLRGRAGRDRLVARIPVPIWEDHVAVRRSVVDPAARGHRRADVAARLARSPARRFAPAPARSGQAAGRATRQVAARGCFAPAKRGSPAWTTTCAISTAQNRDLLLQSDAGRSCRRTVAETCSPTAGGGSTSTGAQRRSASSSTTRPRSSRGKIRAARAGRGSSPRPGCSRTTRPLREGPQTLRAGVRQVPRRRSWRRSCNELKAGWDERPPAHADARLSISRTWPALTTPEKVGGQFGACPDALRGVQEGRRPARTRKMLLAAMAHTTVIQEQMTGLRLDRDQERQKFESLKTVREGLRILLDDVSRIAAGSSYYSGGKMRSRTAQESRPTRSSCARG